MTHDVVVSVGVDADIPLLGKAIVHDTPEYAMSLWHTGNPMDDMIRRRVAGPLPLLYIKIGGIWRGKESKIGNNHTVILYHETTKTLHISLDNLQ